MLVRILSLCPFRMQSCLLAFGAMLCLASVLPAAAQTPTVLHSFSGGSDGGTPYAGLVQASDGNFYGTTAYGGANGDGTVFKITPSGAETVLHSFNSTDGAQPIGGLVQASDGNLYGTTEYGGNHDWGTLFKITPSGTFTSLYSFTGGTDGGNPFNETLVEGSDGNLYGTTSVGGAYGNPSSGGTVFCITTSGALTTLHSFIPNDTDNNGEAPIAGLTLGSDGNLYGTTAVGGANGTGTVFSITTSGTFTHLYSFSALDSQYLNPDGDRPEAPLVQAGDGNLYGITDDGGASGEGTIFQISHSGAFNKIYDLNVSTDKFAGLVQASDGNLYGTMPTGGANRFGTVFQITTSGILTTLYSFSGGSDGNGPFAGLVQASDGNFYGTTLFGGANNNGEVFSLNGVYTVPTLSSLSPASSDAGGPAFTLTVKGAAFQPFSTVNWNGSPLATTYVSASELKAAVPASLIATPGKVTVTVVTGAGGGTSAKKTFTALLTTLKLVSTTLSKNSEGTFTANLTLKNVGYNAAPNVTVTKATLNAVNTTTALPVSVGSIASGSSGNASLTFPASAGTSGSVVALKVSGKFTGGTFSGSLKVTLP